MGGGATASYPENVLRSSLVTSSASLSNLRQRAGAESRIQFRPHSRIAKLTLAMSLTYGDQPVPLLRSSQTLCHGKLRGALSWVPLPPVLDPNREAKATVATVRFGTAASAAAGASTRHLPPLHSSPSLGLCLAAGRSLRLWHAACSEFHWPLQELPLRSRGIMVKGLVQLPALESHCGMFCIKLGLGSGHFFPFL